MPRNFLALAVIAFLFGADPLHAVEQRNWTSPDGALLAHAESHRASGSADYTNWDVITIRDRKHEVVASLSLEIGSGLSRAVVTAGLWSPDSRFFVFQTASSGGHSAWHEPTYVYDAKTSLIYSVDDTIGAITSDNSPLHFSHDDLLHVAIWNINFDKDSDPAFFPRDILLTDFVKTAKVALHSKRAPR